MPADLGRWYQEAVINGVEMPTRRQGSWDTNEHRWNLLIRPFMEKGEGRRFVELGSNAGFYLRKARELGFEAIGVENDPTFLRQARYWEAKEPMGVITVDSDLNEFNIPAAHTVLLANILYWQTPTQVEQLVKKLGKAALNVVVIGRHRPLRQHKSACTQEPLVRLFGSWKYELGDQDSKHFSICFRNPNMVELDVNQILVFDYGIPEKGDYFVKAFNKLLRKLDRGEPINYLTSSYYKYLHIRGRRRKKRTLLMDRYIAMYSDIKKNGLTTPLYVKKINGKYVLKDGDHRYLIAKHLGIKTILCSTARIRHIPSVRPNGLEYSYPSAE